MKKCTKCKLPKETKEFPNRKRNKSGIDSKCKECTKEDKNKYYLKNKDSIKKRNKVYRENNKEFIAMLVKEYQKNNKEKLCKKKKQYNIDNKEKVAKQRNKQYLKNKDNIIKKAKKYRESERGKKIKELYRDRQNELRMIYGATPIGKLKAFCRESLRRIIVAIKKDKTIKTLDSLNYSLEDLKIHIESLFLDGMSWDNHSFDGWHIDHKIPLSKLIEVHKDKSQEEILNIVNALDNLQPLWAIDNLKKGNN